MRSESNASDEQGQDKTGPHDLSTHHPTDVVPFAPAPIRSFRPQQSTSKVRVAGSPG